MDSQVDLDERHFSIFQFRTDLLDFTHNDDFIIVVNEVLYRISHAFLEELITYVQTSSRAVNNVAV